MKLAWLNAWCSRRIVDEVATLPSPPLMILPATLRSLELVRELCRARPCWVTKGKLFERLAANDPIRACLRSPSEIVRLTAGARDLPCAVITLPELVVGNGPSFRLIEFMGQPHYFSLLESALVLRHDAPTFSVRSCWGGRGYRLQAMAITQDLRDGPIERLQESLLVAVEAEARLAPSDWYARQCLAAKTETGYIASVREQCRDIEALLRIWVRSGEAGADTCRELLSLLRGHVEGPLARTVRGASATQ